jgi:hypothetical protein
MQLKGKTKLSVFREVALLARIVRDCRALNFRDATSIGVLGKECEDLVNYHIGKELEELLAEADAKQRDLTVELNEKFKDEKAAAVTVQEKESVNRKINLEFNKEMSVITQKIDGLLDKEVTDAVSPIKISEGDYKKEFPVEKSTAMTLGGTVTADGYQALMGLFVLGFVALKENEEVLVPIMDN